MLLLFVLLVLSLFSVHFYLIVVKIYFLIYFILLILSVLNPSLHTISKSKEWSIINAAFWLVELLLGYMLQPTSSEKRRLLGGKKGLKSSFN